MQKSYYGGQIMSELKNIKKKIPKTDLDYIKVYSINFKKDNLLFKQQNKLINSQIK